jgi:hypothetical protein
MKQQMPLFLPFLFFMGILTFAESKPDPPVVISEVMFDPAGSEYYDEFVEIYNLSDADTVDLSGWQIGDGEGYDRIVSAGMGTKLAPGQYGLILDSGYFDHSSTYDSLIPETALVLTIDGASFGKSGWSNSVARTVVLLDSSGRVVDQYTYTLDNRPGHSDEKINLAGANTPSNWANSRILHGTPGSRNSVSPVELDVCVRFVEEGMRVAGRNVTLSIEAQVGNAGFRPLPGVQLKYWVWGPLSGADTLRQDLGTVAAGLLPHEWRSFDLPVCFSRSGFWYVGIEAVLPGDERPENNRDTLTIYVNYPAGSLILNEVMYYPLSGEAEWVEVWNAGKEPIDLHGWRISTENSADQGISITDSTAWLIPGAFEIWTADSSFAARFGSAGRWIPRFPVLRNAGSDLFVFDAAGFRIDSLTYLPSMGHARGFSLERIRYYKSGQNSDNWALSDSPGGTPARRNSATPPAVDLSVQLFLPDSSVVLPGERVQVFLEIYNEGMNPVEEFEVRAWLRSPESAADSLLFCHAEASSLQPEEKLRYPIAALLPRPGSWIFRAEVAASGDGRPRNDTDTLRLPVRYPPSSVVIHEVMYYPESGKAEWLELVPLLEAKTDLQGWRIGTAASFDRAVPLSDVPYQVEKGTFLVISRDSLFLDTLECPVLPVPRLPALRNTGADLFLFDPTGGVVDYLEYDPQWGYRRGHSLERVREDRPSVDPENWRLSRVKGGTPGRRNSVTPLIRDLALKNFSATPNPSTFQQEIQVSIVVANEGREDYSSFRLTLYKDENRDGVFSPEEQLGEAVEVVEFLAAEDSLVIQQVLSAWPSGRHWLCVELAADGDMNRSNNSDTLCIWRGYRPGVVCINEIMPAPVGGEPEWLELWNQRNDSVDLSGWVLRDVLARKEARFPNGAWLPPSSFALVCEDSLKIKVGEGPILKLKNWPGLNNSEDWIQLVDFAGTVIDEIHYCSGWGILPGVSLERVNPEIPSADSTNWMPSADPQGATPNRVNSVFTRVVPSRELLSVFPNPFSPDGDGFEDLTVIQYRLPFTGGRVSIRIYDVAGREIRTLLNAVPTGSERELIWDGTSNFGEIVPCGVYILYLEARDDRSAKSVRQKKVVVVAGK